VPAPGHQAGAVRVLAPLAGLCKKAWCLEWTQHCLQNHIEKMKTLLIALGLVILAGCTKHAAPSSSEIEQRLERVDAVLSAQQTELAVLKASIHSMETNILAFQEIVADGVEKLSQQKEESPIPTALTKYMASEAELNNLVTKEIVRLNARVDQLGVTITNVSRMVVQLRPR
jgi:hypothetical protein